MVNPLTAISAIWRYAYRPQKKFIKNQPFAIIAYK